MIAQLPDASGHATLFFISSRTGMKVKRAAAGAEGFVLDHYSRFAIDQYLATVGGPLLGASEVPPTAVFCDSLESYGADWTPDLLAEFQRRRGYDLTPLLPVLASGTGDTAPAVRHDWAQTLTELFNDRFLEPLHAWAQRAGTRLRAQVYGIPPASLSSAARVDLPEGEGADWTAFTATRWAAAASHLYGVPVTSSETWTWIHSPAFRATPLDLKAEADRHFLQGSTQLIGHGWPYSPPTAKYPGWRFYAAGALGDTNPWWIVMPDLARYIQRVSFLLRQGRPSADVAVYLPTDDAWARLAPGSVNLFETIRDELGPDLVRAVLESGHVPEFFDDEALERVGRVDGSTLRLGPQSFHVVVLPGVEQIGARTLRALSAFAGAGGVVVAVGARPSKAPGLHAPRAEDDEVRALSRALFTGDHPTAHMVSDLKEALRGHLRSLAPPLVTIEPAVPDIGVLRRERDDATIYFVANTGNVSRTVTIAFQSPHRRVQMWNPLSGRLSAIASRDSANGPVVPLELAPYESRIIVLVDGDPGAPAVPARSTREIPLDDAWTLSFPNGRTVQLARLQSWTADDASRSFSGVATYERSFELEGSSATDRHVVLELGPSRPLPVVPRQHGMQAWLDAPVREAAIVTVNGHRVGSVWCPPYRIDISDAVVAGNNRLRIDVGNTATNAMAAEPLPSYELLERRYGVRFEPQDMDQVRAEPSGLFGPVRLVIDRTP